MDYDSKKKQTTLLNRYVLPKWVCLWLAMVITIPAHATPSDAELSVWTNEAIVAAYTFSATDFLDKQKAIAKYFTADGWINYNKALDASKLKEAVQKNNYTVSAVALLPPTLKPLDNTHWQATMPLLVLYANKDYQQKQTLAVIITFTTTKSNEGVRGLALNSFTTTVATPACRCEGAHGTNTIV
ncbi:MAG: type IV secretion protein IcmL [Legionella sp.]|nr:MAG: type IV secretion protein IcmL [Legionella sp.]